MRIFHVTTPDIWAAAREAGSYTTSTRGRSLEEQGFVHCSEAHQVEGVRKLRFDDLPEVVVLEIETDLLTSPWRTEQLEGADQPYPHVYGPVDLAAVVDVRPWLPTSAATSSAQPQDRVTPAPPCP
jgi:glutathione S-transferase